MKIREKNNIPIIMLSAKTEESDKVIGLSMGADDYVTKPYNTAELMARVKSQLRRYFSLGAANGTTQSQDILKNGGLLLNRNTKELLVDGEPVRLTATEYKIMELLMEHPGYVFSAEEIYSQVWQEDAYSCLLYTSSVTSGFRIPIVPSILLYAVIMPSAPPSSIHLRNGSKYSSYLFRGSMEEFFHPRPTSVLFP